MSSSIRTNIHLYVSTILQDVLRREQDAVQLVNELSSHFIHLGYTTKPCVINEKLFLGLL